MIGDHLDKTVGNKTWDGEVKRGYVFGGLMRPEASGFIHVADSKGALSLKKKSLASRESSS